MAAITAAVVTAGVAVKSSIDAKKAQKDALKQQKAQNASNQEFIEDATAQARADALPLFDEASRTRLLTGQSISNIFSQALPAQADIFTQGNVAAQQALLAGLPQQQAAILGQQLDPNFLQAQQFTPDFSFLEQGQQFFGGGPQAAPGPIPPGGAGPGGIGAGGVVGGGPIFPPGTITDTPTGAVGALTGGAFQAPSQVLNAASPPPVQAPAGIPGFPGTLPGNQFANIIAGLGRGSLAG